MTLKELREGVANIPSDCHTAMMVAANSVEEETPVKKMFSGMLAVALILVLSISTAFATYTFIRSKQSDAVTKARNSLMSSYGLTPSTLGLFSVETEQRGDTLIVTFKGDGFSPSLLGEYEVVLAPDEEPMSRWSFDDIDPSIWQDGNLASPYWGQPQMIAALEDRDAAAAIQERLYVNDTPALVAATPPPPPFDFDKLMRFEDVVYSSATPGDDDISYQEAKELAIRVIMEETGLPQSALDAADISQDFYVSESGGAIWSFHLFVVYDGVEMGCGVTMDGHTGEILFSGTTTGGNG